MNQHDDRTELLLWRYVEGDLDAGEADRLRTLLDERPEIAEDLFLFAEERLAVEEALRMSASRTQSVRSRPGAPAIHRSARRRFRPWLAVAATVAFLACIGAWWFAARPAVVARLEGSNVVVERDGRPIQALDGWTPRAGDTVRIGEGTTCRIAFRDRTKVSLSQNTVAKLTGTANGKQLALERGALEASVTPQRKPMRIRTPHAETTVLGTRFNLVAANDITRLDVVEGTVRFRLPAFDKQVDVGAGQFASSAYGISRRSTGRAVSPQFGGVIYEEYADIYAQERMVLETIPFEEGKMLADLAPGDILEQSHYSPGNSDAVVQASDGEGTALFLRMRAGTPKALRFTIPTCGDEQPEALCLQTRFRLVNPGPRSRWQLRFGIATGTDETPSELDAITGFPREHARAFLSQDDLQLLDETLRKRAGEWHSLRARMVEIGQLYTGQRLYEMELRYLDRSTRWIQTVALHDRIHTLKHIVRHTTIDIADTQVVELTQTTGKEP